MTRRLLNLLGALSLLLGGGCSAANRSSSPAVASRDIEVAHAAVPISTTSPVRDDVPSGGGAVYWDVDEGEAETVLVATITTGRGTYSFEAPLRRLPPGEWPEESVPEHVAIADGKACSEHVSFAIADDVRPGVTVRLSVVPVRGLLDVLSGFRGSDSVVAPAGRQTEHHLSRGVTLNVSFRPPRKARPAPAPPAWKQKPEREREESADVPSLQRVP